jgi:hypothetical protein
MIAGPAFAAILFHAIRDEIELVAAQAAGTVPRL